MVSGHPVSARDGFLRASNHYCSAGFFLHGDPGDPRIDAAYTRQATCFRAYAKLVEHIEPIQIPYEPAALKGYFYRGTRGATVIMHNGFDGSAEEMHFFAAAALHERGFNVLVFDGPGQPAAMRAGMHLRPGWEPVVTPVLDWLHASPYDIDPDRVALLGVSMGGLLAPRAAAFEPRIKALIAFDGVYDMGAAIAAYLGGDHVAARTALRHPEADTVIGAMMAHNPVARWAFGHGTWVSGSTPAGYALKMLWRWAWTVPATASCSWTPWCGTDGIVLLNMLASLMHSTSR
ncbi:hypothetical protein AB0C27_43360 [Nonomuraea sp. NPDC048882]|uniref:alpha/beta hydrolase family protein n=1 Tax=Nonomuraea sp. NPDC048882 TaxID=3154347 RepID=UPI0033E5C92A